MKILCTVATLALLVACGFTIAMADDASGPSVSSCAFGEPSDRSILDPVVTALSRALFTKLCGQMNGALVNVGNSQSGHLKKPGKLIGPSTDNFYPPASRMRHETGRVVLALVVEADGRISRAALLKSTRYPELDKAALAWVSRVSYETPAYLDSMPVRFYSVIVIDFNLSG